MASLFPRWTNTVFKVVAVSALLIPVVAVGALLYTARTPFVTTENIEFEQPIQFDHRHHNWEQGIDCRYALERQHIAWAAPLRLVDAIRRAAALDTAGTSVAAGARGRLPAPVVLDHAQ
jgi:hypothetical protein